MKNIQKVNLNLAQLSSRDDSVFKSSGEDNNNNGGEQSIADLTSNAKEEIKNSITDQPKKEEPKKEQEKKESEGSDEATSTESEKKEDGDAKKEDSPKEVNLSESVKANESAAPSENKENST